MLIQGSGLRPVGAEEADGRREWVNVARVCVGEYVGVEEIDDGIGNAYFGPLKLGASLSPIRELKMRTVG